MESGVIGVSSLIVTMIPLAEILSDALANLPSIFWYI